MATVYNDARVWHAGHDLSATANQVELKVSAADLTATTFSSGGWEEHLAGLRSTEASVQGYWATGLNSVDGHLSGVTGAASQPLTIAPTASDGATALMGKAISLDYQWGGDVGSLIEYQASGKGAGAFQHGTVMHPGNVNRTATGVGTARQLGTIASGAKLYAVLHVLSMSGTSPTLDVVIQSGASAGTATTTRVTFTQATAAGAQWLELSGPITDDWWRCSYSIGGTTPSVRFAVALAIA